MKPAVSVTFHFVCDLTCGLCASVQSPSNPVISYMNDRGINDVMRFPVVKMYNLPITHNKSSERWKNVRRLSSFQRITPLCG